MNTYENLLNDIEALASRMGRRADLLKRITDNPDAVKSKFYKFLNKQSVPQGDTLVEWLDKLGFTIVPPDEKMDEYIMVPKVSAVAGAGASLQTEGRVTGLYAFRREFFEREKISTKNPAMMLVEGDSMEPFIRQGDTILIDQTENTLRNNEIFVARIDEELMVKRAIKIPRGWRLCSLNPERPDIDILDGDESIDFQVYGRVRWFGRVV